MAGPLRIVWGAPQGIRVQLDEDGVTVRFPSNLHAIEEAEVDELLAVIDEAKRVRDAKSSPVPTAPTRDEIRAASVTWRAQSVAKRVSEAVLAELDPRPDEAPF